MFGFITLFSALSLAATAAWFAIVGIVALFGGNPVPVMIMGAGIELAKIVGVSWLYRNWDEANWRLKWPGVFLVLVVMLLTSMGIFGFLSKAHIEQNADVGGNTLQIERLDQRIGRQQAVIDREQVKINNADAVLVQLDTTVSTLIEYDKISGPDGARAVREGQQSQRDALAGEITVAQNNIDAAEDVIAGFQDERLVLSQAVRELELEVGPVKYIAALIYEDPETNLEDAVRIVIIMFIFVFDPMAIWLLMAANHVLLRNQHMWGDEDDPHNPPSGGNGEDLINLIDDNIDDEVDLEPKPQPKQTVDRAWLKEMPEDDEQIDDKTVVETLEKLENRETTDGEKELMHRLNKLAISRNLPPNAAREIWKRSDVHTRNDLLKQ